MTTRDPAPAHTYIQAMVDHFIAIGDVHKELCQVLPHSAVAPTLLAELATVHNGLPEAPMCLTETLLPLFADLTQQHGKSRMERLIDRLLAEAPKLTDADGNVVGNQSPAIECLVMVSAGAQTRGALSKTPEGVYKVLSPGQEADRPVMIEQFFAPDSIVAITLIRKITVQRPSIILPSS